MSKKKQCNKCFKWRNTNSFDGEGICAKCNAIDEARLIHREANQLRYKELTQQGIGWGDNLFKAVWEAVLQNGTFGETSRVLGVNRGLLYKAANGEDSPKLREMFGLSPKNMNVKPCRVCGEVHIKNHPNPKDQGRFRRAAEFATKERAKLFDEMVGASGLTFSEICNQWLDKWIWENSELETECSTKD
jgi:hypothetical protein